MNKINFFRHTLRRFSTTRPRAATHNCKLLIVGGGTGGCATAAKCTRLFAKSELLVLEPSLLHYYQPLFTLVGGGTHRLSEASRRMGDVLPEKCTWLQDSAGEFDPHRNSVTTNKGDVIRYDFLLLALGLQTNYDQIPGLIDALDRPDSGVCSNYSPHYVNKTYKAMTKFKAGNAIFTFPNTPVKCPGAPQKICYITEHYLRKNNKREHARVIYNTSLPVLFGVSKYADALWDICDKRNIEVNLRSNLIEVKPDKNEATFQDLDRPATMTTYKYSMLHVTPPMSAPDTLRECEELTTPSGFVDVNKDTMQSTRFPNVFAIGDCASSPNSKTAAAAAAQCGVVYENLKAVMGGREPTAKYDGYASCPLVTGYDKCILAEFDYNLKPLETFPFDQKRELWSMLVLKKDFMPTLYWKLMLNGRWNGPAGLRNLLHLKIF